MCQPDRNTDLSVSATYLSVHTNKLTEKAGTIGIIGVYPPAAESFPIGRAMNKNLSINAGNCNHRAYIPKLVEMVRTGVIDPVKVLTKVQPLTGAIEAYEHFDKREAGWIKTELKLAQAAE